MPRTTINAINAALKAKGHKAEVVKGTGYFWFTGDDATTLRESGVYVYHLSDMTVDQWVAEFESKVAESKHYRGE